MAKGGGANRPRFRLLPTVLLAAAILLLPTAVYAWGRSSGSFTVNHVSATGTEVVPRPQGHPPAASRLPGAATSSR